MAACRQTGAENWTSTSVHSRKWTGLIFWEPNPCWHTSPNKATPTPPRPHLQIVLLPTEQVFKPMTAGPSQSIPSPNPASPTKEREGCIQDMEVIVLLHNSLVIKANMNMLRWRRLWCQVVRLSQQIVCLDFSNWFLILWKIPHTVSSNWLLTECTPLHLRHEHLWDEA